MCEGLSASELRTDQEMTGTQNDGLLPLSVSMDLSFPALIQGAEDSLKQNMENEI
jgi:hypothetical protein